MRFQFVLFDGFDPLDVIAPFEVVVAASQATAEFVSAEGARDVPSGLPAVSLRATSMLDPARADVVVVPGAVGALAEIPPILGRTLDTALPRLLADALTRDGVLVATVCGGSLIPAMAGLLEGRNVTTHHLGLDLLDASGVTVIDARVVDDGDLISAASVTSGLDLGLYLLERQIGPRGPLAESLR